MTIYRSDNTQPTRKGGFLGDFTVEIKHNGKVHKVEEVTPNGYWYWIGKKPVFVTKYEVKVGEAIIINGMPNREFLADFIKLNNIKKTRVSLYLGMAENWLTTMVNEKRATRKDISDATFQDIMRKLHIDWTSQEFINVKATKSNTAYKTKPCNYSRMIDKERLQRSMWNGELVA